MGYDDAYYDIGFAKGRSLRQGGAPMPFFHRAVLTGPEEEGMIKGWKAEDRAITRARRGPLWKRLLGRIHTPV